MSERNHPYIFVVTGAESTGKSVLSVQLANYFKALCYKEFAREYISNLKRPYSFSDIEIIGQKQVEQYYEAIRSSQKVVIFDTWLLITKTWFEVVYKQVPYWVSENIKNAKISGFILNDIDIAWEPDGVRENGGKNREILHERYKAELEYYRFKYFINTGLGAERLTNAVKFIEGIMAF